MPRFPARRALAILSALLCLAACAAPTTPARVSATATTPLAPTASNATPTSASASGPCQPDTTGLYAAQTSFVATLPDAPLPAPPQTKHGVASSTTLAHATLRSESGMCTIGTFASVTAFYSQQLPALGWQYSAPPAALYACYPDAGPPELWWKGSNVFSWFQGAYESGDAGGSTFWTYDYCSVQS